MIGQRELLLDRSYGLRCEPPRPAWEEWSYEYLDKTSRPGAHHWIDPVRSALPAEAQAELEAKEGSTNSVPVVAPSVMCVFTTFTVCPPSFSYPSMYSFLLALVIVEVRIARMLPLPVPRLMSPSLRLNPLWFQGRKKSEPIGRLSMSTRTILQVSGMGESRICSAWVVPAWTSTLVSAACHE